MKIAAQYFGEELLGYLGVKEKSVRVVTTDIIQLEARQLYRDFNLRQKMVGGTTLSFQVMKLQKKT